jgi:hypothetical protein
MGAASSTAGPPPAKLDREAVLALVGERFDQLADSDGLISQDLVASVAASLPNAGKAEDSPRPAEPAASLPAAEATPAPALATGEGGGETEAEAGTDDDEEEDKGPPPEISRNKDGSEEPHSAKPNLYNIDGTEVDMNGKYKVGGQLWYLQSRAKENVADKKPIAGVRISEGPEDFTFAKPGLGAAGGAKKRRASTAMKEFLKEVEPTAGAGAAAADDEDAPEW